MVCGSTRELGIQSPPEPPYRPLFAPSWGEDSEAPRVTARVPPRLRCSTQPERSACLRHRQIRPGGATPFRADRPTVGKCTHPSLSAISARSAEGNSVPPRERALATRAQTNASR